jgi:hypothetical protein
MAKLQIHVFVQDGKTTSKFRVGKTEKVVFHNRDSQGTLTVSVASEPGMETALCVAGTKVETFTITPQEKKKVFDICGDYRGETFKYTAQIGTAAIEDPIVIIETGYALTNPIVIIEVIAGAVLLLGGYLLGRWHANRSRHNAPMRRA